MIQPRLQKHALMIEDDLEDGQESSAPKTRN